MKKFLKITYLFLAITFIFFIVSNKEAKAEEVVKPNVIDISGHQPTAKIDFKKWKQQGIKAVVIKLTEGMEDGKPFYNKEAEAQIKGALDAGLKLNFYHYSWMNSVKNAKEEADWFAKIAKRLNVPKDSVMALDLENPVLSEDPQVLTDQANAFFEQMRVHGFNKLDVYANKLWYDTRFFKEQLTVNNYWLAYWPSIPIKPPFPAGMWQFASDYKLEGYDGLLDANIDYNGFYTGEKVSLR